MTSSDVLLEHQNLEVDRHDLMADAWDLYSHASFPLRLKQRLRPKGSGIEVMFPHIPAGSSVLDIGCGSGLLLGLLAQQGRRISGVGFDPRARDVELAREMAEKSRGNGSDLRFECRDGREADWPEGSFDVVTMVDVIHHVPVESQRAVFDKACAAVRPGGVFVYKDMGLKPRWRAFFCRLHDVVIAREWIHPIPVAIVEQWAAENSFTVEAGQLATRAWYVNELRVFRKSEA